ncbi:MAG: hypothetical protein HRU69_14570 [Flammeovirgaceae bacterium]|nr:MAG: hypothetical protein HRU69_14570 [Flammeovirgaceae bacterium]
MRSLFLLLIILPACRPDSSTHKHTAEVADSAISFKNEDPELKVSYENLYGQYLHESNTRGFTALLELSPLGNDLSFTVSLQHSSCESNLNGTIGMVYHGEDEYAGFFDSEPCRLAFNFFLAENKIRIDEIGICQAHPTGCSFGGTYVKRKTD